MKRQFFIIICISAAMVFCQNVFCQTSIAVLDFTPEDNVSKSVAGYITDVFREQLVNSEKFVVVERAKLKEALSELKLQNTDLFDENSAVRIGKLVGAEMVFYGKIINFDNQKKISVSGMDVSTATVKYALLDGGNTENKLEKACKRIVAKIINGNKQSSLPVSTTTTVRRINREEDINIDDVIDTFTETEKMFYRDWIKIRWRSSPSDRLVMRTAWQRNLSGGITMVTIGSVFLISSIIVSSVFGSLYAQSDNGGFLIPALACGIPTGLGGIIMPLISICHFRRAYLISSIYQKTTGRKLALLDRAGIGGGYDWKNKNLKIVMSIRF